ncbi:MAG: TadE/TadG family type IV pilus assembly protein [Deltaproteobacteria bacterium]
MQPRVLQRVRDVPRSGQAIVLLAVMASIVAFTLLTTFAIGEAVQEKIQLQQAADAASYSLAVQEARTFNFFAYTNRAMLSHYVAILATYGHMSYLAAYEGYLEGLAHNWGCGYSGSCFVPIPDQLFASCNLIYGPACLASGAGCGPLISCNASAAAERASIQGEICPNLTQKIQTVQQGLGKVGGGGGFLHDLKVGAALPNMGEISAVSAQQVRVSVKMAQILKGQALAAQLAKGFDGSGKTVPVGGVGVDVANITGLGSTAGFCKATDTVPCGTSSILRTQVEASNASRNGPGVMRDFLRTRNYAMSPIQLLLHQWITDPEWQNVLGGNGSSLMIQSASGAVHAAVHAPDASGYAVAGEDHGHLLSTDLKPIQWSTPVPPGVCDSNVQVWAYSEPSLRPAGGEGQSEVRWGDGSTSYTSQIDLRLGSCNPCDGNPENYGVLIPTAEFKIDPSELLFNQPRTFALLGRGDTAAEEGPYAMNRKVWSQIDDANHTYDNVITDAVPWKQMLAASQGLAYYHRPGDWTEPPNFYNPFWRAKLHPFAKGDLAKLLGLAKYTEAARTAAALPATE